MGWLVPSHGRLFSSWIAAVGASSAERSSRAPTSPRRTSLRGLRWWGCRRRAAPAMPTPASSPTVSPGRRGAARPRGPPGRRSATRRARPATGRTAALEGEVGDGGLDRVDGVGRVRALDGTWTRSGRTMTAASRPASMWVSPGRAQRRAQRVAARGAPPRPGHPARPQVGLADEAGHEDVGGPLVDLDRGADLLDPARVHHRDAVAHRQRLLLVVGHVDERDADLALDALELELHDLAQLEVEAPSGSSSRRALG